ncbi:hypothetical protein QZH41_006775 [Actinostola sp. cb2023]|nr:hypothetical protein QZH41_006775 [Actinostola sp. cb2023]
MSHIPQAKTGLSLKPTNKILKPIQGGGGTATSPSNSTAGVVKPRGTPAAKPAATPGTSKTPPSGGKSAGAGSVVKPRGSTSTTGAMVSPRGSVFLGGTSATPNPQQQQPKFSRENSATRLQYRREGSSSSLHSTGSESAGSIVRRRGSSQSQQGATSAADLKKFFSIGDRVLVSGAKPGAIAFIGDAQFAKGDWAGVILDEPTGKNSGTVAGVRYFDCKPLHGVFTKLEKITKINKVSETLHSEGPSTALEIGDRVVVSNTKIGTVRYVGTTGFAKGDWAGIELDEPLGKNDGAVAGTRKNEDLLFKLEEEEITLGDELKTDKSDSDKKVDDMEFQLLESNQEMSSIQLQLEESQTKVKELEKNLSSLEEKHTAQCSEASRGRKEQLERIAQLEEDISSRNNRCKELEVQLQNANTELRKAQEENETLKPQIEDLTSKLYSKENEFASMSDELKHIKAATLELQKQLQLSEAKSYNLTTDKTKLENEIAELMKSSGNNSERLTYLNGQLREKDRLIDEIKTSLAEAEADAGLLTGEIAQAKESYASDVDKLTKSHDEQIKKLTNQINSLNIERAKNEEIAALSTQIDEKADQFRKLSEEYDTIKTQLLTTMQERDSVKVTWLKIRQH